MVIRALLWLSLLLSLPALAISQLHARLDKNPVMLGESVVLEVTADSRLPANSINFRVLENDFTVMVPSVNQSTRVVNGEASHSTSWVVTLLPKASGTFQIPAFSVDSASSQAFTVEVLPAQQASGELRDIFLKSTLSSENVVVQQMVYYDVSIYFSGDIQRGSLSEPQLENALIQQVGQDQEGSELIDGERYRSITRRYAITPQRSGYFNISPPTFSGDIIDRDNARQSYFARSRTVVREAQTLAIDVQPQASHFTGNWLVAGLVTLNDEWQPDLTELVQGEPITRIITLSAVDVAANQLPDLQLSVPDGFRVYQEQPQTKGAERAGRLVAQKIITSAIIANTPGEYRLPEVKVPWWNSQTNRMEQAVLPGRTLQVKADPSRAGSTAELAPSLPGVSAPALPQPTASAWGWNHTSTVLALGWLLSSILLVSVWRYPRSRFAAQSSLPTATGGKFDSRALRAACQKQDKTAARQQLLKWAHQQNILKQGSLTALSQQVSPGPLRQQLQLLNAALYGDGAADWQAGQLFQAWSDYQLTTTINTTAKTSHSALPPLYPQ